MIKLYNVAAVIGRFQGLHFAHEDLLREAGDIADKVVVHVGSAFQPRTHKNPWTAAERAHMLRPILTMLSAINGAEYIIEFNIDTLYDYDGWITRTQQIVAKHSKPGDKIALVGHNKDADTTEYLSMFPQWDFVPVKAKQLLDATTIRELYFQRNYNRNFLIGTVPSSVLVWLDKFRETPEFEYIMAGKRVVEDRRKQYANLPYPMVAVTVDAVVICDGHILLIQRKSHPGKDLWALPGGYFDAVQDDEPVDGIVRELDEETMIDVPAKIIRGSIEEIKTFSHKQRSLLGRSITHAGLIRLKRSPLGNFPKVKGADDAKRAKWVPFNEIKKELLFDDHFDIISHWVPLPTTW
jgi:bifunctional NMN adenylyltransferase/nudix hydrolase